MRETKHQKKAGQSILLTIVTLDRHLAASIGRANKALAKHYPGLEIRLHAATEWANHPDALAAAIEDVSASDLVVCSMMFVDDQVQAIMPALVQRREQCKAMVCCVSTEELVKLTRMGQLDMKRERKGPLALLKKLRPKKETGVKNGHTGAGQMAMLRRLPKILKFIPGTAQDLRVYFLVMQYWLSGSDENVANMIRLLVAKYVTGTGAGSVPPPIEYPEVGLYHPSLRDKVSESLEDLPAKAAAPTVGLLLLRSYVLVGDARHYDGVIATLEDRGLRVVPAFASGLDQRPAIERFFMRDGKPTVDAVLSLTGFSLVGGPAYNNAAAAEEILKRLDVPYLAAHALEFQTLEEWNQDDRGLSPVESTIMVAIPEIDGATVPSVFGGRSSSTCGHCEGCFRKCEFKDGAAGRDMIACTERAERLADRVQKIVRLKHAERADRRLAVTLFNFPPNAGATGTAAYLSVFESLHQTLGALKAAGYHVEIPETVDELRDRVLGGNSSRYGQDANVHQVIAVDDYVRRETHLAEIEAQWGPAPGRQQSSGSSLFVLGERFGNVFVGIQPSFGYEGDPMRLLFEKGFAPTHAFSAYYRWLREDFDAHAVLHFGTHGALEFMPGKQSGLGEADWPDRLIGDLPNYYLYAANNPSEGALAKRRANATLISYMTPPLAEAGLYQGLNDLKATLERYRGTPPTAKTELAEMLELIQAQAALVDLAPAEPAWENPAQEAAALSQKILEMEYALIPHGLHVVGVAPSEHDRVDMLAAIAASREESEVSRDTLGQLVAGVTPDELADNAEHRSLLVELAETDQLLTHEAELPALVAALDGRFVAPAPGGDIVRNPEVLPTGRNIHGFDPFRIPSAFAMQDGERQAQRLLDTHMADGSPMPRTIALVLWGADNLKSEGAPLAQALALMGARPRFDGYGRVCGAELISLEELGRPRIDVMTTLSGIFRDLLPLQTRLLSEAAYLAASAEDEPAPMNFVRANTLAFMARNGTDLETAALRVFSNAEGAYGANVNMLVDSGSWNDDDELAEAYSQRKCFAFNRKGTATAQPELLNSVLSKVDLAYQNLESVELGVTTIDHYFDTLGGIGRAVKCAKGEAAPTYISDQTQGEGKIRTLAEQVALETRTRTLNPKWFEGMLEHGHEGVRQIEAQLTNTVGWSATTGQVDPWVYQRVTETFVLDEAMRKRIAELNPKASVRLANRLIEAHERNYWSPDEETLEALNRAGDELEDRLEGIALGAD
ncbi:MAG: magnesium chelatase subunit H [Pseudomonadota bacterium]